MAASFAVHKMVTSGGFLRFESVTSRSLAGTLCLMFFLPSTTNTPRGHEEGELISGKVVLRLAQGLMTKAIIHVCEKKFTNAV